jgi:hypothetical protein
MAVVGWTRLFVVVEIESRGSRTDVLGLVESIARCAGAGVVPDVCVSDSARVGAVVAIGVLTVPSASADVRLFAAARFSRSRRFFSAFFDAASVAGTTCTVYIGTSIWHCLAASRAMISTLCASSTSRISSGNGIPSPGGQSRTRQ